MRYKKLSTYNLGVLDCQPTFIMIIEILSLLTFEPYNISRCIKNHNNQIIPKNTMHSITNFILGPFPERRRTSKCLRIFLLRSRLRMLRSCYYSCMIKQTHVLLTARLKLGKVYSIEPERKLFNFKLFTTRDTLFATPTLTNSNCPSNFGSFSQCCFSHYVLYYNCNRMAANMESSSDEYNSVSEDHNNDLDWDNFFPYVEFCDSGSEEEIILRDDNTTGTQPAKDPGGSLEWISSTNSSSPSKSDVSSKPSVSEGSVQADPEPSISVSSPLVKTALCVPSALSPPPGTTDTEVFKKPSGKAKIAKKVSKLQAGRIDSDAEIVTKAGRRSDNLDTDSDSSIEMSGNLVPPKQKSRRSLSLESGLNFVELPSNFSIVDMVEEAEERDFRRATSVSGACGPLLSSTIDEDFSDVEVTRKEIFDNDRPTLRGNPTKNKTDSLKESFRKRAPTGKIFSESKEISAHGRKERRNNKFDEARNLKDNGTMSSTSRSLSGELQRDVSRSPIISSTRRGPALSNWADISIGSEYSVYSDKNATISGPRRKTRRGRKKKRNLSVSNTSGVLTESFIATIENGRKLRQSPMSGVSGELSGKNMDRSVGPYQRSIDRRSTPFQSNSRDTESARRLPLNSPDSYNTTSHAIRKPPCPVLHKISELVQAGNPYDRDEEEDLNDSRVVTYDNPYSTQRRKEDHPQQLDKTQEIDLDLLLPSGCKRNPGRKIKSNGVIQFVVMRRPERSEDEWEFFPRKTLENLINYVEGRNAFTGNGLSVAFKFANMWGEVPLLGLFSIDISAMTGYRFQVELYSDGFEYQTFPRDALDRRLSLTIMLWQNLEGIEDDAIAPNLLDRNRELAGGVKVAKVKNFRADDLDTRGVSMLGARLVQLDGNETFLRSLEKLPKSHRFGLGVGTVIIRGGNRAPEPPGSSWGQSRPSNRPNSYSDAASRAVAVPTERIDLNISTSSLRAYANKANGVMNEAERSIRGRKMFNKSSDGIRPRK